MFSQRVKKVQMDFFDTLSDILTYVKMFLTVRESGGDRLRKHPRPMAGDVFYL